jgi:hypothetical protein
MIEFDDRVVAPQACPDVLPGDHFPGRFEEHPQDLERLLLKPDFVPVLAQLACPKVELERSKSRN